MYDINALKFDIVQVNEVRVVERKTFEKEHPVVPNVPLPASEDKKKKSKVRYDMLNKETNQGIKCHKLSCCCLPGSRHADDWRWH